MNDTKGYTQTISTADFNETPRVSLEQPTGDVIVKGWDKPEIEVSTSDPEAYFEVEQNGSQILIRNQPGRAKIVDFVEPMREDLRDMFADLGKAASTLERHNIERTIERSLRKIGKHGVRFNFDLGNWRGGRDYYIKVPHTCDVTLRTSSGDINILGISGTIFCQTSSGDLNFTDVGGNVLMSTASGDISIKGMGGKLGLRTASGDVEALDADLQEVSASTASGDLNLDLVRLPSRGFEVKTVSGDLNIYLPVDSALTLETRTISGDLRCGFPRDLVQYTAASKRETVLRVNGGGPTVQVSTVSGDIALRVRKTADTATPSESGALTTGLAHSEDDHGDITQPEGHVSRQQAELEILQKVERGEITPQQALEQLSSL